MVKKQNKFVKFIHKLLCRFGFHDFSYTPTIANLDNYWLQGGTRCARCNLHRISYHEASILIDNAYKRGKDYNETHFVAYGNGLKKIVELYGEEYCHNLIHTKAINKQNNKRFNA